MFSIHGTGNDSRQEDRRVPFKNQENTGCERLARMLTIFFPVNSLKSLLLPFFVVGLAVFLNACGGEEPAPEPVVESTAPTESTPPVAEKEATPPPGLKMGEIVPDTLSVLRFMPEEAQIALALPSVPGMRDKVLPLLRVLMPDEDIDELVAEAVSDLGDEIGVEAKTYEELAAVLGLDAHAPLAFFVDLTQTVQSAVLAKEAHDALQEKADAEVGESEEAAAEGVASEAAGIEEREAVEPKRHPALPVEAPAYFDDAEAPALLFVLGITDSAKVRTKLEEVDGEEDGDRSRPVMRTETVAGMELSINDEFAYFLTDTHLFLGDVELVKGAADRVKNPATFRYGSVECPATAPDEITMLLFGNRLAPLFEQSLPMMMADVEDAVLPHVQSQLDLYQTMFAAGDDEDPIVGTLSWTGNTLEMLWRVDTKMNPGVLEVSGDAQPLRLARYLPENTLALLSFRFNDVFKKQITDSVLPAVQAGGGGNAAMASQIIPQIGDELTLGITDVDEETANIFLMLGLAQPEATQGILSMFVPMEGGAEYNGYTINNVPLPLEIPLFLSFVDDFALLGTSEEGTKAIIDRHAAKDVSGVFARMDPPFDIDLPRYQALNFDFRLLGDALSGLVETIGFSKDNISSDAKTALLILRELRLSKELGDGWLKGRLSVYFNDLDAAAAKIKAVAGEVEAEATVKTENNLDTPSES